MKETALYDIPVALIFFNRSDVFKEVFECVRNNRPSQLFLIQDGPRDGRQSDVQGVDECRRIASNIDWECEVHYDYATENLGCGKRIFTGLTNAFKIVDRLVIIEDDILISNSFLPFCQEMLERYKDDKRINLISGMNHFGIYEDCPYSYFFSRGGAIWGWATWKRVWDDIDWSLDIINDEYIYKTISRNGINDVFTVGMADKARQINNNIKNGINPTYWSFHLLLYSYLETRINIVPKYNQISNIGFSNGAHSSKTMELLPKEHQMLYFAKRYEMDKKLIHPKVVFEDRYFKNIQDEFMCPTGWHKKKRLLEQLWLRIKFFFRVKI